MHYVPANVSLEGMIRQDYVDGRISLEQFEDEIALMLTGGFPERLIGGLPPLPMPAMDFPFR